jgi:hypothetical protein
MVREQVTVYNNATGEVKIQVRIFREQNGHEAGYMRKNCKTEILKYCSTVILKMLWR